MISISPDPAHPRGGYALLTLPEGELEGETTQVAVFDNYSERYLGEAGWQPVKVLFGPYDVMREGGQARVVIGPEIVNQIEEYANVKLLVGTAEQDLSWPDEVVPAPGAAKIGGIMGTTLQDAAPKGTLTAKIPEPELDPEPAVPEPEMEPVAPVVPETPERPEKPGRGGMLIGLLALVLIAAGIAYWFVGLDSAPQPVDQPDPVAEADDPCGIGVLSALDGFAAQRDALLVCAGKASADAALGLLEKAAAAGDAEALLLFGTVYDGQVNADVIEDQIGLTFEDAPATAAEYYARAVAAGSETARAQLTALCDRMSTMDDTLAQGAVADHCGN
ncbi:MAG: hypothetical protein AAF999_09770 [Pseudomonadota bacterium]